MATAMTTNHAHGAMSGMLHTGAERKSSEKSTLAIFASDLIEDLSQPLMQPASEAKHDIFREHINAMAILYFGFIVALIACSLPVLAYLITY